MTEAIFGLIGVLIGGLLNGGVSWVAERRNLRSSAKVAARVLLSEIEGNNLALKLGIEKGEWGHVKVSLANSEWLTHRITLAAVLHDPDWRAVDSYYAIVANMIDLAQMAKPEERIEGDQMENLVKFTPKAVAATEAIHRHLGITD